MKRYKVGIIGYGWVATRIFKPFNATSNAQEAAIYSSRPLDDLEESKRWNTPIKTYTDLQRISLADKELDIVSICSYPYRHKDHAIAAAGSRQTPDHRKAISTFKTEIVKP